MTKGNEVNRIVLLQKIIPLMLFNSLAIHSLLIKVYKHKRKITFQGRRQYETNRGTCLSHIFVPVVSFLKGESKQSCQVAVGREFNYGNCLSHNVFLATALQFNHFSKELSQWNNDIFLQCDIIC